LEISKIIRIFTILITKNKVPNGQQKWQNQEIERKTSIGQQKTIMFQNKKVKTKLQNNKK